MPESTLVETASPVTPDLQSPAPAADDVLYEVIDGRIVETPAMGAYQGLIASALIGWLYKSGDAERTGRPVSEVLFKLTPDRNFMRRPDVAFVSYERWPRKRRVPEGDAWDVIPDLAVEVVSPTNSAAEVVGKLEDYFRAGVRLVWVIYSNPNKVYVYTSPTAVRILQPGDDLDGGAVIPGFRVPVRALFDEDDEAPPA